MHHHSTQDFEDNSSSSPWNCPNKQKSKCTLESKSEAETSEAETTQSSTPELNDSDLINDFHDNNDMYIDFEMGDSVILHTPSEEMGLSLPASSVDGNIVMAHSTHLASTPSACTSAPDDPLPLVIPGPQAQACPSSADPRSAGSDVVTNLVANQHPKCMVRH